MYQYYVYVYSIYIYNIYIYICISHDICLGEAATADRPDLFVGAGPAERSLTIAIWGDRYVVTMWMVAKSCITKRMVETLTKYIMGCLPSINWCRISQPSTVVSKIIQSHTEPAYVLIDSKTYHFSIHVIFDTILIWKNDGLTTKKWWFFIMGYSWDIGKTSSCRDGGRFFSPVFIIEPFMVHLICITF